MPAPPFPPSRPPPPPPRAHRRHLRRSFGRGRQQHRVLEPARPNRHPHGDNGFDWGSAGIGPGIGADAGAAIVLLSLSGIRAASRVSQRLAR